jgi:PKHD-type hydroxylase
MLAIPDLLAPAEVGEMNRLMDAAEYDDGRTTAAGMAADVKANRQVSRRWSRISALDSILDGALRRCRGFRDSFSPSACSPPTYARYLPGDGYGPHVDAVMAGMPPMRQDISITVFLAAPDAYVGGELCLHEPDGGRRLVKPAAGQAFAYPTTCVHEVLPVTAGERRVAVLWFQSFYRDPEIRGIVADLRRCLDTARGQPGGQSLEIAKVLANLERKFIGT